MSTPKITATGARRRVHALQALGWTLPQIAHEAGLPHESALHELLEQSVDTWTRFDLIDDAYERICMTIPARTPESDHARAYAAEHGWLPPLAWDDIDHDPETGAPSSFVDLDAELDEAAIMRRLNGDRRVRITEPEALEIIRRGIAAGRTLKDIEQGCGLNVYRRLRSAS